MVQVHVSQQNHIEVSMNLLEQKTTIAKEKIKLLETKSNHDNTSHSMLEQRWHMSEFSVWKWM